MQTKRHTSAVHMLPYGISRQRVEAPRPEKATVVLVRDPVSLC